ncbi:LacI family DNA-binding transcriptional regulator [Actinomadura rugatobispora]|uniref:LacI family DNA-binding transcriptional regulator n=1 Tax=Actinomadura rugatobispora TaxID=1994 RepID=A0ABW0ZUY5_9ACTN|nr:LacI family DNA-binding transcriptional regulator [Actinomadura rugatobispora]
MYRPHAAVRDLSGDDVSGQPENGKPPSRRPATSVDVARLAGVSRATVSHVLNGQVERFSAETVERVRGAAAALGYVRSTAGRALVRGRGDFIVLAVPHATVTRVQEVIEALSADIEELGFTVVVHFAGVRAGRKAPDRLHHMIETLRPAGVVNLGGLSEDDMEALRAAGCLVLPRYRSGDPNLFIGRLQAGHLHARGRTEIAYAFTGDRRDDPYGPGRAEAVAAFCAEAGLAPPAHLHVPIEAAAARKALERLVSLRGRPVGIACYNDEVALALVFAAKGLGLEVPGDVAVIGVERTEVGQVVSPRLTTVAGDLPAIVGFFRYDLARAYGGAASRPEPPGLTDGYRIYQGETT